MNRTVFVGDTEYFPGICRIEYEGPDSNNPLSFKAYDRTRLIAGKTMEDRVASLLTK